MGTYQGKKWPKKQEGCLSEKTQEQHTEKSMLELDSGGINLEGVSLSDSVTKEGCFCDLE